MSTTFNYNVEQFADLRILRFQIPEFESLPLKKKMYLYYLSQAALCGRDITWDQNGRYNLWLRRVLTLVYETTHVTCATRDEFIRFEVYFKRVLFSGGFHHHYSTDKLTPELSEADVSFLINHLSVSQLDTLGVTNTNELLAKLRLIFWDDTFMFKRVCQDPDKDLLLHSSNNFYRDVTQTEVENYYQTKIDSSIENPVSHGLNSRLQKQNNQLVELVWSTKGIYGEALTQIVNWLRKASLVAENPEQVNYIETLCQYYETGDLKLFDKYSIQWLQEHKGDVDFVNGFIEVYGDSLGYRATWESLVNIKDNAASLKAEVISEYAQWFENQSPVEARFRKTQVKGVSMKVISAVMLGGDCYPTSPLGINLPNSEWIRELYGSKSVSLENISHAYHQASLTAGVVEEFTYSIKDVALHSTYGALADNLHTNLHECLGHGSGRMLPGVKQDDLKAYGSVIEEARADLYGLYFMADPKMLELNLVPHMDVYKVQYNSYLRNGLMVQMARIQKGKNIEQAHMRNRQLVCKWVLEKGHADKVIERKERCEGKTFYVINDHEKLRHLFGLLLAEVQRIKSTGDYEAARHLVETYGVVVDADLHAEVLQRYGALNVAPYSGFVNPVLTPVLDSDSNIKDVTVTYSEGYLEQMLRYGTDYGFVNDYDSM